MNNAEDITKDLEKVLSYSFLDNDGQEINRTIYRISYELYYTVTCNGTDSEPEEELQEGVDIFTMMNEDSFYSDKTYIDDIPGIFEMEFHENPEPVAVVNGVSYFKTGANESLIAVSEDATCYTLVSPRFFHNLSHSRNLFTYSV